MTHFTPEQKAYALKALELEIANIRCRAKLKKNK